MAISNEMFKFVKSCSKTYVERATDMKFIHNSKVFPDSVEGSGFCIRIDTKAINNKDAGKDRVILEFVVSDGEYSVKCIAHNAEEDYLESGITNDELADMLETLTVSQKEGKRVEVKGHHVNHGRNRVFLVDTVFIDDGFKESQMSEKQFKEFKNLCKKNKTNPLNLMIDDKTLWAELYAKDYLKKAIMLYALSPAKKQDMIHIGIVSSHGEGKDHLIERVIQPILPCRRAGSGKMATIPGLFGAMSGDDLNAIEIGLLPKMNHERVAISEFQTWNEDTFGELMNMMANGKIEMQKGALDVERETTLNLLFLGNPPAHYDEEKHEKRIMLDAFGKYTLQILSRLSLIFTQLTLAGDDAQYKIREAIVSAMDGDFENTDAAESILVWRKFFREYFRYVSRIKPKLKKRIALINSIYDDIEGRPHFQDAFCMRKNTDNRKYQEFANLVRAFARLYGDEEIKSSHVFEAQSIFEKSLQTLTEEFPIKTMLAGVNQKLIELYEKLLIKCPAGYTKNEMRAKVKFSNSDFDTLINLQAITPFDDGTYFVNSGWQDKLEGGGKDE